MIAPDLIYAEHGDDENGVPYVQMRAGDTEYSVRFYPRSVVVCEEWVTGILHVDSILPGAIVVWKGPRDKFDWLAVWTEVVA